MTRKDVIVVASVSAIYNLGSPVEYGQAILEVKAGMKVSIDQVLRILTKMYYERNDIDFHRSTYRLRGDTLDIFPSYKDEAVRVEFLGDKVEKISILNPLTGQVDPTDITQVIFPASNARSTSNASRSDADWHSVAGGPKDFLLILDESHMTIPQIRGMYNGDQARKSTLIDFGFRLPSALDNRPLRFDEFIRTINQV